MNYAVQSLDELERIPVAHGLEWRPIRRRLGIAAFGVNAYTAEKLGDWIVEEHTEETNRHEEVYFVVRGRARFTLDGEEVDAPAGTIVHISDPGVRRVAVADEAGTTVLAVGAPRGEAFFPTSWEWYFEAYPLADAGKLEEALKLMRQGLHEHPDNPAMLYHVACLEARSGLTDDALTHVRRAIELRPQLLEEAREDEDLAPIREAL
jgi:hypothetical protein